MGVFPVFAKEDLSSTPSRKDNLKMGTEGVENRITSFVCKGCNSEFYNDDDLKKQIDCNHDVKSTNEEVNEDINLEMETEVEKELNDNEVGKTLEDETDSSNELCRRIE